MSGQLIELIVFAGIAIYLVSKLINMLGSTSEDDPAASSYKKKTFYIEEVRDVQDKPSKVKGKGLKSIISEKFSKGSIVAKNKKEIVKGLNDLKSKMPNFSVDNFLKSAKLAFKMIIEAGTNENEDELKDLVDIRYIEHFKEMMPSYGNFKTEDNMKAEISEIYMFGNNAFVKVLFAGKGVTSKVKSMHEEWTFSRNTLSESPAWQLTNIDRPQ